MQPVDDTRTRGYGVIAGVVFAGTGAVWLKLTHGVTRATPYESLLRVGRQQQEDVLNEGGSGNAQYLCGVGQHRSFLCDL